VPLAEPIPWPVYLAPVALVLWWLAFTAIFGLLSGWFGLQSWYPDDGGEAPLVRLRGQSAGMGFGVGFNGALTLRAYPSGLGIAVSRLAWPFQRPLRIPWDEIEAAPASGLWRASVKLRLGRPARGTIRIGARAWAKLLDGAPGVAMAGGLRAAAAAAPSRAATARLFFVQWLLITAVAGGVFFAVSQDQPRPPPAIVLVFLAVVIGAGQVFRFLREV
jgi:hypothetical protein